LHLSHLENTYQLYDNVLLRDENDPNNANPTQAKIIKIDRNRYDVLNLEEPYEIEKETNAISKFDLSIQFNVDDKVIVLDLRKDLYTNMKNIQLGTITTSSSSTGGRIYNVQIGTNSTKQCNEKQLLPYNKKIIKELRNYLNLKSTTEKIFEMYEVSIVKMFFSFRFDHKQNGIPTINENTTFSIYKGSKTDISKLLPQYYTRFDTRIYEMNKNCKKVLKNIKNYFDSHSNTIFPINDMYQIIVGNVDDVRKNNNNNNSVQNDDQLLLSSNSRKNNSTESQESYYLIVLN